MAVFQKQTGDIVELTPQGMEEIQKHKNNYADSTKPLSGKERTWSAWDMGNLWIGMIVSIAVYQVASGLIVSGMSWAQALFTIVLGHTLVMIFAVILGHFGTKYAQQNGIRSERNGSSVDRARRTRMFLVRCAGVDRRTGCQRDHHRIDPGMGKSWV